MSRSKNDKIPTQASGGGLFNAFANLEIEGLPDLPQAVVPVAVDASQSATDSRKNMPGRVVLRRETAHRGGKCVVVLDGFDSALDGASLQSLAKRLRAACGCGGAVKERTIELQGDQVPRIRQLLTEEGFRVAGVG